MAIGIFTLAITAGYFAGFAHADLIVTWRQRHHVSTDAIFMIVMAGVASICAIFVPSS